MDSGETLPNPVPCAPSHFEAPNSDPGAGLVVTSITEREFSARQAVARPTSLT
jgi:hypothetical protein